MTCPAIRIWGAAGAGNRAPPLLYQKERTGRSGLEERREESTAKRLWELAGQLAVPRYRTVYFVIYLMYQIWKEHLVLRSAAHRPVQTAAVSTRNETPPRLSSGHLA